MFLKNLIISSGDEIIRKISFHKGVNLIIDKTVSPKQTGNNVGKTTVLRLIDFCLGGKGENIYKDTEFRNTTNTQIEDFLKNNNVTITLTLAPNLDFENKNIVIKRNFLTHSKKILTINGENITNQKDFPKKLNQMIFNLDKNKPTFRQIIAKNIRDEKNRLKNTIRVLDPHTTNEEYETLYLFWLGIILDTAEESNS